MEHGHMLALASPRRVGHTYDRVRDELTLWVLQCTAFVHTYQSVNPESIILLVTFTPWENINTGYR